MKSEMLFWGLLGGGIVVFLISKFAQAQPQVTVSQPSVYQIPEEPSVVPVPVPYPTYPPEAPPAEEPPEDEPYAPPEGPDFYTSYTIAETWMLNYFQNVDPGPIDAPCSMEFVRYDTLRSPYSWSFTFDYVCLHNGTGTYRRTVNVIAGIPSMGY